MDAACAVAAEVQASEPVKACLGFQFLNRISPEVQQATRINVTMSWVEARARLRDQYGGQHRPLTRHAWKAMTLERERGEKESEFAHRLAGEMRLLKRRVTEAGYQEAEATWCLTVYEELGVENLRRNLSESSRKAIMSPKITTVEEATQIVEDEEAANVEYRGVVSSPWVEVRRRPRVELNRQGVGPRTPPAPRRLPTRDPPVRSRLPARENVRLGKPECWACGQVGHLKRNCPYIYHRDRRQLRPGSEPMEVNAGRWVWRRTSDDEYSSGDEESVKSYRQKKTFSDAVKTQGKDREGANPEVPEGKLPSQ